MRVAVSGFLESIPDSRDSHRRGWMELCAHALRNINPESEVEVLCGPEAHHRWKEFDKVYFHHGLYWYGQDFALNLFGGMTREKADEYLEKFTALREYARDHDVSRLVIRGSGSSLEYRWPVEMMDSIQNRLKSKGLQAHALYCLVETMKSQESTFWQGTDIWMSLASGSSGITMGDSHCGASWLPGHTLFRNDRETLHGALKRGLASKIRKRFGDSVVPHISELTLHYGNIDLRHHLCRQPDVKEACRILAREYVDQVVSTCKDLGVGEVTLVDPYPIENESRRILKSVYYKDRPFWGSWTERTDARRWLIDFITEYSVPHGFIGQHRWPLEFYNSIGELRFDVMERPQSIHLSPRYYRWNLFQNKLNDYSDLKEPSRISGFFEA